MDYWKYEPVEMFDNCNICGKPFHLLIEPNAILLCTDKITIICLCGNAYEDEPAGRTVEPRCPECALKFAEKYPDTFIMPPKAREIAEAYVQERRDARLIPKVEAFLKQYPSAEFGPGHVVLSDYNWDSIDFCLTEIQKVRDGTCERYYASLDPDDAILADLDALETFLKELHKEIQTSHNTTHISIELTEDEVYYIRNGVSAAYGLDMYFKGARYENINEVLIKIKKALQEDIGNDCKREKSTHQ